MADAAALVKKWNSKKCATLALEAEAVDRFYQSRMLWLLHFRGPAEERSAVAARWQSVSSGCSQTIRAAMETVSGLDTPEPQACNFLAGGLCQAMPILVRMAHADPPPCIVEEVLALWVREAEANLRLDERTAAWQDSGRLASSPTAAADADDASSVFSEMPALERVLFNADMRARARKEPLGVRRVFHAAMAAALEQVRAVRSKVDMRDALVLLAFQHAACRSKLADRAREHAVYSELSRGARIAAAKAALKAMAEVEEGFEVAAYHGRVALAARRAASTPPGGPGSAPRSGDEPGSRGVQDDPSEEAELADLAAWVASTVGVYDRTEPSHHVPDDSSEEPDEMEAALDSIDGQWGDHLTSGRNMCAPAALLLPWGFHCRSGMQRVAQSKP